MNIDDFYGLAAPLGPNDYARAAKRLDLPLSVVKGVAAVESRDGGFGPDGRPIILYEPHIFSRRTQGRFDASHPHLSYPKWRTRPYPASQAERYDQLFEAMALDEAAALKSASWGAYQIMGFNHAACGYESVQLFVQAMTFSEARHLNAFCAYLLAHDLDDALRERRWADFVRGYNGPGQVEKYSRWLQDAYAQAREVAKPDPSPNRFPLTEPEIVAWNVLNNPHFDLEDYTALTRA